MLRYWILRRPDGTPAGLVRVCGDRALLTLSTPVEGRFTLFSEACAVPVTPGSEACLSAPLALLGDADGRMTCFAASPDAGPVSRYLDRLSRICTKKEVSAPEPVDISQNSTIEVEEITGTPVETTDFGDDLSQNNTMETEPPADSVSDTAHETAEFALLLRRADAFYAQFDPPDGTSMVRKEDMQANSGIDLFPQQFPGARWRYVDGADVLPHYEGTWRSENGAVRILAVRGRAAPRPPRALPGFTRYLRDRDGFGYWVKITGTNAP